MSTEPKERLTIVQRFKLMEAVKYEHGRGLTDAEFAREQSEALGFKVNPQTVASYREAFGIPQTKLATPTELRERIRELEAKLAEERATVVRVGLPPDTPPGKVRMKDEAFREPEVVSEGGTPD